MGNFFYEFVICYIETIYVRKNGKTRVNTLTLNMLTSGNLVIGSALKLLGVKDGFIWSLGIVWTVHLIVAVIDTSMNRADDIFYEINSQRVG